MKRKLGSSWKQKKWAGQAFYRRGISGKVNSWQPPVGRCNDSQCWCGKEKKRL